MEWFYVSILFNIVAILDFVLAITRDSVPFFVAGCLLAFAGISYLILGFLSRKDL